MRTEREIRRKLSRIRHDLKRAARHGKLWRVMDLQISESLLVWVLREAANGTEV